MRCIHDSLRHESGSIAPRPTYAAALALGIALVANSHALWSELASVVEHCRRVEEALARVTAGTPKQVLARLLSWNSGEVRELDDPADAAEAMRAAALHAEAADDFAQGRMLVRAGSAGLLGEGGAGEALLQKAQTPLAPFGATKSLARCLSALASARLLAGDPGEAQALHARAGGISRRIGA